jgi:hypothetical protein
VEQAYAVTPTGAMTEEGFMSTMGMVSKIQKIWALLLQGDIKGALHLLEPFEQVPLPLTVTEPEKKEGWYDMQIVSVSEKHKVQIAVPKTYEVIQTKEIKALKASHADIEKIKDGLRKEKCCFPPQAKQYIAAAVIMAPKLLGGL